MKSSAFFIKTVFFSWVLTPQSHLGGRFDIFYFFSARGGGGGSPRRQEGGGVHFLLKMPGGGGFPGGAEGPGGCLRRIGEFGRGGQNIFFGAEMSTKSPKLTRNFLKLPETS